MVPNETVEEWRPIVGFPMYEISSHGRIKSQWHHQKHKEEHILKTWVDRNGYHHIKLCNGDGVKHGRQVHVLVCEAFNGNRPAGKHCAHGDGNPQNNYFKNLRWATPKENCSDRKLHGTENIGERNGFSRLTVEIVREIKHLLRTGVRAKDIAALFQICPSHVAQIKNQKLWKHIS